MQDKSVLRLQVAVEIRTCLQEEQRRVSNREMCRDELLGLLREATAVKQSFADLRLPANSAEGCLSTASFFQHNVPFTTAPLGGFM